MGGYAVAFHGYPRFTKDIDIFYRPSAENAERIRAALLSFGFQPETISIEMLLADELASNRPKDWVDVERLR